MLLVLVSISDRNENNIFNAALFLRNNLDFFKFKMHESAKIGKGTRCIIVIKYGFYRFIVY